jgi:hypothetical protein
VEVSSELTLQPPVLVGKELLASIGWVWAQSHSGEETVILLLGIRPYLSSQRSKILHNYRILNSAVMLWTCIHKVASLNLDQIIGHPE